MGGAGYNIIQKKLNFYKSKDEHFQYFIKKEKEKEINILYIDDDIQEKYSLNIIYYDENLIRSEENDENCAFFQMNTKGTFYGCHYFELFKNILKKIKEKKMKYILITSGSSAEKIFDHCSDVKEIREYYIYCYYTNKYTNLLDKYPKLKGVYCSFDELKKALFEIPQMQIDNISSSNLIFFEDYNRLYIKLHYEFIRQYSLYKLLKSHNCDEKEFLSFIKKENPNFLNLAKQLFPNKNKVIEFFKNNTNISEEILKKVFECDDNILNDNIKDYIFNYTQESFYYKYLNKFLREGNFDAFRKLSSHISKFIFKLYEYREKNIKNQNQSNLYRKMYLHPDDIKLYLNSEGRVICYPAFSSASIRQDKFNPKKYNEVDDLVLLEIEQNDTKSVVLISEFSDYPEEEEYLFLPFSFFKIKKVKIKKGTEWAPHIIYLIALNSEKPIEEIFTDFMKNETDNINPEGLDFLIFKNWGKKIEINPIYFSKNDSCLII